MNDAVFKVKVTQGSNMATKGFLLRSSFQNENDERKTIEIFF
jgi:hypothetical protein